MGFNTSLGCLQGARSGKACCAAACGGCAPEGCAARRGGAARCCPGAIVEADRACTGPADVGCVVPGVGEALELYCHWLLRRPAGGAPTDGACLASALRRHAKRMNVSEAAARARTLRRCVPAPRGGHGAVVERVLARGCDLRPEQPVVWLAAVVRDQSELLEEWLLWHLLLGVRRVLLYDNNSRDQKGLLAALRPFVHAGAATVLPWPAHASQTRAYDDAIRRARREGVPFVAAIDVDERLVPYGDGCVPSMLLPCTEAAGCAGLRLNVRISEGGARDAPPDAPNEASSGTLLRRMGYNRGTWAGAGGVVKTIVRTSVHVEWHTPHSTRRLPKGWCLWDERGRCPANPGMAFARTPPTARSAFVLHLQCRTLRDWLVKKTLTGRIDMGARKNPCPSCFGALEELAAEYEACCPAVRGVGPYVRCTDRPGGGAPPANRSFDAGRANGFLRTVDELVRRERHNLYAPVATPIHETQCMRHM